MVLLLTPLPLIVLANSGEAEGGRRSGIRVLNDVLVVVAPALLLLLGLGDLLAGTREGVGLVAGAAVALVSGTAPVLGRLARVLPIVPGHQVHRLAVVMTTGLVTGQLVTQLTTDVLAQAAAGPSLSRLDLVAQEIPFLLAAVFGVGLWTRRPPAAVASRLGLARPRPWQLLLALAAAGAFYAFGFGVDWLSQWLTPNLANRVNNASGHIFRDLGDPVGIATIAIAAGVCEEIFFRGALQPRLGLLWTAIVFASVHTQYGLSLAALAVLVLAVGLGLIRRYTNTTSSMLCHVAYNALVGSGLAGIGLGWAVGVEVALVIGTLATLPAVRRLFTGGVGNPRPVG